MGKCKTEGIMIELFKLVDEQGGEVTVRFEADLIDIHWSRPKPETEADNGQGQDRTRDTNR